jgi:hypothetical protein
MIFPILSFTFSNLPSWAVKNMETYTVIASFKLFNVQGSTASQRDIKSTPRSDHDDAVVVADAWRDEDEDDGGGGGRDERS